MSNKKSMGENYKGVTWNHSLLTPKKKDTYQRTERHQLGVSFTGRWKNDRSPDAFFGV